MDIQFYTDLYEGLVEYNKKLEDNYGNTIYDDIPKIGTKKQIDYPITIIQETRNNAIPAFNTCFDRVSSVGYMVDIFAKTKGKVSKQTIAREIAKQIDVYMNNVGLQRVGFVPNNIVNDGALYRITMTYTGNLHENRRKII